MRTKRAVAVCSAIWAAGVWILFGGVAQAKDPSKEGLKFTAKVGDTLPDVNLKQDKNDTKIRGFGQKVLTVIYADMQASDDNDPVADAIKAKDLPKNRYEGIGVANMVDSWVPNWIIRSVIKKKREKYESTILSDENYALPKSWNLGDCNDVSVVIVVGKDRKIKYIKKGKVEGAEIDKVVKLVVAEASK